MSVLTEVDGLLLSAAALAELLGVSRETVARLAKMEGMPKHKQGQYNLKDCFEWYINRERDKHGAGETPADKKARMEVAKEQALRYRIENAKNLNELLPADLVQNAINQMASTLANQLDGLGARMAVELSSIDDPAIIQRKLFDECRGIRNAATASFAAIASDIDSGGDTEAAAKPKRGKVGRRKPRATASKSRARTVADG